MGGRNASEYAVPIVSEPRGKYYSKKRDLMDRTSLPLDPEEVALIKLLRKIESKKIKETLREQLRGIAELERQKKS